MTSTPRPSRRPSRGRGDPAAHHVVAREPGRHQVLGAVLDPLHRPAGQHRARDRADVAGIDRDLVAEAAADVGRDDADLVLGQPGDRRVQRAMGVRRLRRAPHGELAADGVVVGDRAAGLHRRRVRAREQHVLLDDDVGARERGRGRGGVARLPVEDVVGRGAVGALAVVADHRGVGVERAARVDDGLERFVLDVDQLERVAGRVVVVGDDERDLLALEAHLVGREHRLPVGRHRRHPRHPPRLEVAPRDDRVDPRQRQRRRGVDRDDPGVGERAAQDRAVQHPVAGRCRPGTGPGRG